MALPSTMIWEISTLGNIDNGGGFDSAFIGTGTDYSQQASPQVTFNGSTIKATTASASNTITLTGYTVSSTDVGNTLNITGGTNFVAGRYAIASVNVGSNTWTLTGAATATTGSGAAMTGRMGGSVSDIGTIVSIMVTSNVTFVKADGIYTITSGITNTIASASPSSTTPPNRFVGYGTVRGDGVRCSIVASGATGSLLYFNGNGWHIYNVDFDGGLGTSTVGIRTFSYGLIYNCKVSRCTSNGFVGSSSVIANCEVTGCVLTGGAGGCIAGFFYIYSCYIHDNTGIGILGNIAGTISNNIISNNSGAFFDGVQVQQAINVVNNTIYDCGRHGISINTTNSLFLTIQNNILSNNGGYGIQFGSSDGRAAQPITDGNAYYNNTSGPRNFGNDTTVNPQNAVGAYMNVNTIMLAKNPFMDVDNNDFRLNSIVGGGLSCIGVGVPQGFAGNLAISYADMGAIQMPKNIRKIGLNGGYSV